MDAKQMYDQKLKRIHDAIELKEPDTVPYMPIGQCYPYINNGYTMADILYDEDTSKALESLLKFAKDTDADVVMGQDYIYIGQGKILEMTDPKSIMWAGMPNSTIDKNSIHQFIEFPVLLDDEMDMFLNDRSQWMLSHGLPRTAGVLEPMKNFNVRNINPYTGTMMLSGLISTPEFKEMIEKLWKINDLTVENQNRMRKLNAAIEEAGYPVLAQGMAAVPFDTYSDFHRGTVDGLADLYDNTEVVEAYCEEELENTLEFVRMQGQFLKGRYVFMALHKGMDGFMSDEFYEKYYWKPLQRIIEEIIANDMIPYIYTEGNYNTRLKWLADVPEGKVIYHFENVDMKKAKEILGGTACISGGFSPQILDRKTPEETREAVKKLMDVCAPGGGFIFETSYGLDYAKPENVDAMTEAVREFGKY
ncbi:MAG: uroporphyrinogen decarboxylase family protein [Coriobacteriales bacterium]|jgi:uroporphyrinogen-III decarboxylase